jgi:signal transduction histidine kinase
MSENWSPQALTPGSASTAGSSKPSLRSQLLWASIFPLAFFGLLFTLVIYTALNQMVLSLVTQRNTAQVQALGGALAQSFTGATAPTNAAVAAALQTLEPVGGSQLYVIDPHGNLLASSEANLHSLPLKMDELARSIRNGQPSTQLTTSTATTDEMVVSFAPLPGGKLGLVLTEPWTALMWPAFNYELVLVGLLTLGSALSLVMLSLSINRIIRPIAGLAEKASGAVPGSVFHPVPEHGPQEIRALINAFNQMVIRLAEQQTALRQYAQKALLSQEEERQRLSHELHDGTLQDLVGLAQRVELCRSELEVDPRRARQRLDELQKLLGQTLDDVRRISNALRPPVLEDFGLTIALEALCKDLRQERPSVQCDYTVTGVPRRLQPDLELAVYRVVQEALTNIRKHALDARRVQVNLAFGETEVQGTVKNDGAIFTNREAHLYVRSGHLGLAGMYERARLFGGNLNISADAEDNTVVSLQLPFSQDSLLAEKDLSV